MQKYILITGATSGIGEATVLKFSQNNYQVFATYRANSDKENLEKLSNVHPIKMDVTNKEDIKVAYKQVYSIVGENGLYAIINNAGVTYTAPVEYANEEKARYVTEVNVWAPFNVTQKFIPLLKQFNTKNTIKSRVVNITSWAGILSQPFNSAYNISKFGIVGLTEAMYYDLGLLGIHAIDASPGVTKTPLLKKTTDSSAVYADLPDEGKRFYKKHIDYLDEMSSSSENNRFLLTANDTASSLFKIVEKKKPKAKYKMSLDAKLMGGFIRRYFPFKLRAAIMKRMYSLK